MKLTTAKLTLPLALLLAIPSHAQPPARKPVTPELRQKLRTAVLETQAQLRKKSSARNLALTLAKLGDWDTALRLANGASPPQKNEKPFNATCRTITTGDKLWTWRARQLALAGKWREAADAAAQITTPFRHLDTLLYAVRAGLERGLTVMDDTDDARQLKSLLLSASPLLSDSYRHAYAASLWARGGDFEAAHRLFEKAYTLAKTEDAKTKREEREEWQAYNTNTVIDLQADAGMWTDMLRHVDESNFQINMWVFKIKSRSGLEILSRAVEKQTKQRAMNLMLASVVWTLYGDKDQGRLYYEKGRQAMAQMDATAKETEDDWEGGLMSSYIAAYFLGDQALLTQTKQELQTAVARQPEIQKEIDAIPLELWPAVMNLQFSAAISAFSHTINPAELEEISKKLRALPASDEQFSLLVTLANYCFKRNHASYLRPIARAMAKTASIQDKQPESANANAYSPNPYLTNRPKMLTAIEWLQKAGEATESATRAREFTRNITERERPFAALELLRLGYPEQADTLFNPVHEAPNWKKWQMLRTNTQATGIPWQNFAAEEARHRSPESPLRWVNTIKDPEIRADILAAWVSALYPQPSYFGP